MKALTKEKKEKENVLTNLELINMNNVFLSQSKELRRKTTEAKIEQLMEDKKEYQRTLQLYKRTKEGFGSSWYQ